MDKAFQIKNLEIYEELNTQQNTSSGTSRSSVMPGGIENYLKWPKPYGFMFVHILFTSADLNTASSFKAKKKKTANFIHNKNLLHNVVTTRKTS